MAERTKVFVNGGTCNHCGRNHEPWVVVCPVARLPITPAAPTAMPVSPRAPTAPPRGVIPPSPAIPRTAGVIPRSPTVPRTTPAMGVPRASTPVAPRAPRATTAVTSTISMRVPPATLAPNPSAVRSLPSAQPPAAPIPPPAAPTGTLVGRVIGDRYGVSSVIGEGGMGVVYEAEHLTIGKLVAVKVLHPSKAQNREAVSRLRREARVAGTLGHPNICAVYDMGRLDDGSPYIVMERLHGETLAQRVARLRRLAASDMVDIMLQVLSALAAAHQRGVVHRDLKPDNIFLSQRDGMRPVPKLLDFGISKAEDIEETVADPTGAIVAAGTPFYMAPEQARGDRNIDWRIDLWSAGVVLYEGISGHRPFHAKNYNALLVQILSMRHPSIRDIDPALSLGLARVVDKALSKRADDRYQSALEFQSALRSYKDLESEPSSKPLPVIVNDPTEDSDATTVFHRINFSAPAAPEEDATPIYGPGSIDDERTIVETPAFLTDMMFPPGPDSEPRRKR